MTFEEVMEIVGKAMDAAGVVAIIGGTDFVLEILSSAGASLSAERWPDTEW